jgi:hypothetical protein
MVSYSSLPWRQSIYRRERTSETAPGIFGARSRRLVRMSQYRRVRGGAPHHLARGRTLHRLVQGRALCHPV